VVYSEFVSPEGKLRLWISRFKTRHPVTLYAACRLIDNRDEIKSQFSPPRSRHIPQPCILLHVFVTEVGASGATVGVQRERATASAVKRRVSTIVRIEHCLSY